MRLIDADELKLSHCKECTLYPNKCMGKDCDWGSIAHINMMPTIDAVPVRHGKWCEGTECYSDDFIVCSVCGEAFNVIDNDTYRFDYCPNCGARMDEDETDRR